MSSISVSFSRYPDKYSEKRLEFAYCLLLIGTHCLKGPTSYADAYRAHCKLNVETRQPYDKTHSAGIHIESTQRTCIYVIRPVSGWGTSARLVRANRTMTDISHVNLIIFPSRLQVHEPVVKHISSPMYHSSIPESEPHNIQANADTAGNPYHKSLLPLFTSSTSSDEMNRRNPYNLLCPSVLPQTSQCTCGNTPVYRQPGAGYA